VDEVAAGNLAETARTLIEDLRLLNAVADLTDGPCATRGGNAPLAGGSPRSANRLPYRQASAVTVCVIWFRRLSGATISS
jgi:hypothetical protein